MATLLEWYAWGLFLGFATFGALLVCLSPLAPYRSYPVFYIGRRIVSIACGIVFTLIAGMTIAGWPIAVEVLDERGFLLFRLVTFSVIVLFGWWLRRFVIRRLLTPPPNHPVFQNKKL